MHRLLFVILAAGAAWSGGQWTDRVPPKAAARQNPYAGQNNAVLAGAKLYSQHCAACHGAGREGSNQAPPIASARIKELSDGQLFWLLTNGSLKAGMPSWSHLPPEQRWQIVTFLRGRD